ncbi:MAG: tRNA (adenosine(37)-N6)-dimethylallyltransferase MiaA [Wolinella sp.]
MELVAILGASGSGKSELALRLARELDCYIFSLDSLSIYREINIASAKPRSSELSEIRHFAVDILSPSEPSNAALFSSLLNTAYEESKKAGKRALLIVGGSSFFLKAYIDGLAPNPPIDDAVRERVAEILRDKERAFLELKRLDPHYCEVIFPHDSHRLRRGFEIFFGSGEIPSDYFARYKCEQKSHKIRIYELSIAREILRERILLRTIAMLRCGLIDEVCALEARYTRAPQAMKSIGVIEVLEFLDGRFSRDELRDLITTHTAQLAKRQSTFNRTQFGKIYHMESEDIYRDVLEFLG